MEIINSFEIPCGLISYNKYSDAQRANKYYGAKIKKDATELVALFCKKLNIDPGGCYDVTIDWFVDLKQDSDNVYSSIKFILDGVVFAGKLANDNARHIWDIQHRRHKSKSPKIIVTFNVSRTVLC